MRPSLLTVAAAILLAVTNVLDAQQGPEAGAREPIIGGPCEGCEAVFEGLPDTLTSTARIAPPDEPGEPMRITGTVYDQDGEPAPGVIVYAYQTNANGVYPPAEAFRGQAAYRHGELRAWVRSDGQGRYRFDTIRPASYPNNDIPAHVHMHVIEPGCCTYYLTSIHFADDPLLTAEERERVREGRGGSGLVTPERDASGVWLVTRDIHLGQVVPGYAEARGRD
jgi:protocatechuate 3,4-dioxygenase beta subunit